MTINTGGCKESTHTIHMVKRNYYNINEIYTEKQSYDIF